MNDQQPPVNPYLQQGQQSSSQQAQPAGQPAQPAGSPNQNPYAAPNSGQPYGQNPYVAQGQPYGQNPYVAQGQPYAAQGQPYTAPNQGQPYGQNPYTAQGQSFQQPVQPAGQAPKKHTGCIVAAVIVGALFLLLLGSCTTLFLLGYGSSSSTDYETSSLTGNNELEDTAYYNELAHYYLTGEASTSAFTESELSQIQSDYFSNEQPTYSKAGGIWRCAADGEVTTQDLPTLSAGTYWIGGEGNDPTAFMILEPSQTTSGGWDTTVVNTYYGHNIVEMSGNQILVVFSTQGFCPINEMTETFTLPVTNGVFRVGTDIPAGTYQLAAGPVEDDYYAFYVMSDLSNTDESITDGGYTESATEFAQATVTVHDGEYLELYNATLTLGARI